jgi:hypothetical protein
VFAEYVWRQFVCMCVCVCVSVSVSVISLQGPGQEFFVNVIGGSQMQSRQAERKQKGQWSTTTRTALCLDREKRICGDAHTWRRIEKGEGFVRSECRRKSKKEEAGECVRLRGNSEWMHPDPSMYLDPQMAPLTSQSSAAGSSISLVAISVISASVPAS